jgi:predicted small integral membrane protein
MNRMAWIYRAALELVLGTVLLVLGTVWRYPATHFGVRLGLQYGVGVGWVSAPHAARLYVAAMQDAALLVGTLLIASAVFVCWELARSEQREKPGLLA